jgi:predicted HAD superfamily Cof-like phosphohydrolase
MIDTLEMVRQFQEAAEIECPDTPYLSDLSLNKLRYDLLKEELEELKEAMDAQDPVAVLDALTDLQYVLDGAYLALGLAPYKETAFLEVQGSNMSKFDENGKPIRNANGKVMKGPNYYPPDLNSVIYGD